jgi:sterol desaturase/sphingolipid hydroxylase (fatty acid hydroxylase superfamily)
MESFVQFFENLSIQYKVIWIVTCVSASWFLETVIPVFRYSYSKGKHAGINFLFLSSTMAINVIFGLIFVPASAWAISNNFGLFYHIDMPIWASMLLGIMIFDFFAQYVTHFILHKVPFLWPFHTIHHSDTTVDTTSGTRHHPVDYMVREVISLAVVLSFGISLATYSLYKMLSVFFTYTSHANIKLPGKIDQVLSWVFVTPNVHKFHHHKNLPWTDSNFGNIFSIWDRALGTFVYAKVEDVDFGLDILDDKNDQNFWYQLKLPFLLFTQGKDSQMPDEHRAASRTKLSS